MGVANCFRHIRSHANDQQQTQVADWSTFTDWLCSEQCMSVNGPAQWTPSSIEADT